MWTWETKLPSNVYKLWNVTNYYGQMAKSKAVISQWVGFYYLIRSTISFPYNLFLFYFFSINILATQEIIILLDENYYLLLLYTFFYVVKQKVLLWIILGNHRKKISWNLLKVRFINLQDKLMTHIWSFSAK